MELHDLKLLERHLGGDRVLEGLYKEHLSYEKTLSKLNNKLFLTPEEEVLRKELQKKKLQGKDKMEMILKKYRG